jgi:phosphonate transport system substrate-binding protein
MYRLSIVRPVLAVVACLFVAAAVRAAPTAAYNFSPVNQYNLQVSAAFWNPIIRYVSQKSGVKLNLKLGRTSADTTSYVLTLAQLAGESVAFPGPEAMIAYKVAYAQLQRRNIPVDVIFAGNMDAAFTQLFAGKATAVGANSQLVQNYQGRERKTFRVLWSSEPFNDLALMASPRVPADAVRAVAQAFFGMDKDPEGRRILAAAAELVHAQAPISFVAAGDADYASYRAFYADAPLNLR